MTKADYLSGQGVLVGLVSLDISTGWRPESHMLMCIWMVSGCSLHGTRAGRALLFTSFYFSVDFDGVRLRVVG